MPIIATTKDKSETEKDQWMAKKNETEDQLKVRMAKGGHPASQFNFSGHPRDPMTQLAEENKGMKTKDEGERPDVE